MWCSPSRCCLTHAWPASWVFGRPSRASTTKGIGRLGAGLQAVATAPDGVIEAVELSGFRGWYLGVQWHPEDTVASDPNQAALFAALVAAAQERRSVRTA